MKRLIGLWVAIGFFPTTACASAQVSEETISLGGLQVTVWSQTATTSAPQPVVLFSHGFHGCSTQSTFLMKALASDGFLVFAPNHADATCNGGTAKWSDPPPVPFIDPQAWSDSTFQDRAQDIDRLVQAVYGDDDLPVDIPSDAREFIETAALGKYLASRQAERQQAWR